MNSRLNNTAESRDSALCHEVGTVRVEDSSSRRDVVFWEGIHCKLKRALVTVDLMKNFIISHGCEMPKIMDFIDSYARYHVSFEEMSNADRLRALSRALNRVSMLKVLV